MFNLMYNECPYVHSKSITIIIKVHFLSMNNAIGKLHIVCIRNKFCINYSREKYSREKSSVSMYVVSIVAYQDSDFQDRCRPHKNKKLDFHTSSWDWVRMRTIIIVQEVEVHGWLLSGSEEITILCCSCLTILAITNIASALVQG